MFYLLNLENFKKFKYKAMNDKNDNKYQIKFYWLFLP